MNIITNVVAPMSAVVPRSTSVTMSASKMLTIASGMTKPVQESAALFFVTRKPPREKKDGRDLRDLGGLANAPCRSQTQRREPLMRIPICGTKQQASATSAETKPDPPGALPKMVIDQRARRCRRRSRRRARPPAFHEKVDVAMAVARERARAEKHDDADDQHARAQRETENRRSYDACVVESFVFFAARRLSSRNDQLLADLQFARIVDVIDREQFALGNLQLLRDLHRVVAL